MSELTKAVGEDGPGAWILQEVGGALLSRYKDNPQAVALAEEMVSTSRQLYDDVLAERFNLPRAHHDPEDRVYVDDVSLAQPHYHEWEVTKSPATGKRLKTLCGATVRYSQKATMIPIRHAQRFAVACPDCAAEIRSRALDSEAESQNREES